MKLFTLVEANETLEAIKPALVEIQRLYTFLEEVRPQARDAAAASEFGGGMAGGTLYVNTLYTIGKLTTHLHELGIELKDHQRGLIDFPAMREGRVVYLCWQFDDGGDIQWWHDIEAGFAGRKPI